MSDTSPGALGQAVLAIRWGTTGICIALASPELVDGEARTIGAVALLVLWTAVRTFRPGPIERSAAGGVAVLLDVAVAAVAVSTTGYHESSLLVALLTPAAVAGFSRGFSFGVKVALLTLGAVAIPWLANGHQHDPDAVRTGVQWAGEVVLVALVAGYARRISGEADERREAALDRLGRLSDANVLLFQLHQVTQTLPASLDLTEVLDNTVAQLRDLFPATGLAIVLHDEADGTWHTVRRHGLAAQASFAPASLPGPLARTVALRSTAHVDDLATSGPGLDPVSRSGLYGVLTARGATIGLIALEHGVDRTFSDRDVELLTGFVDPAALAVDNARWFGRLRSVGADEERARIARDLHDRTGQSLAYVAFELDRITKQAANGNEVTDALDGLRGDVRKVVGELRDTLYDLRTDVTERDGLASTLAGFLDRVQERSSLQTELHTDEAARLPLLREREVWRIARDAITSVERLGRASRLQVLWRCDGQAAELEVADDAAEGAGGDGALGAAGLAALRERAAGIGATVVVLPGPGGGTRVRCTLAGR